MMKMKHVFVAFYRFGCNLMQNPNFSRGEIYAGESD